MIASLAKLRFLLVDDSHHMRNILKTLLRGFGVNKITEAAGVMEAFDLFRTEAPDIIILDLQMDYLTGADFTRMVRTSPNSPNPFVAIILLTAHSERRRVESARDSGVNEICAKPIMAAELYRKIHAVVENPRPFIRSPDYFGPCRRRHHSIHYTGPERRKLRGEEEVAVND
jgi:CheY-like chemotaxis protein